MIKRNLFFLASLAGLFGLSTLISGSITRVIEVRAILMLISASFLAMSARQSGSLFAALRTGIFGGFSSGYSSKEMAATLKHFENCMVISGVLVTIYTIVNLLANLASPEMIGPNLALAMNASIYAVAAAKCLIMPLRLRLMNSDEKSEQNLHEEMFSGLLLLGFPVANYVLITVVLYSYSLS